MTRRHPSSGSKGQDFHCHLQLKPLSHQQWDCFCLQPKQPFQGRS
ncbi:hypothetical protein Gohar_014089 [Gossypium harknessii]|uniref:Uncharacterized protein n=1 Tax=Gossypium harknessii TaxID=34285 RepID=A0A7J9H2D7_9ROSI|nr:hypothetical protein [Gossypium harknessii]